MSEPTTVLVVGVPRSGTSWVGRVLGSTPGAGYLGEPDNHAHCAFALRARLRLPGRFYTDLPVDAVAPAYELLWREAFAAVTGPGTLAERARARVAERMLRRSSAVELRRSFVEQGWATRRLSLAAALAVPERAPANHQNLVVKSVNAPLALDWITARFPVKVVVVLRRPLNILSSWKKMGWIRPDADLLGELDESALTRLAAAFASAPVEPGSAVEDAAQLIALLQCALVEAADRHPEWVVVWHEELCDDPQAGFREAASTLGLEWDAEVETLLEQLNRPGEGYATQRVAAGLPGAWRDRLTPEEVADGDAVFSRFGLLVNE